MYMGHVSLLSRKAREASFMDMKMDVLNTTGKKVVLALDPEDVNFEKDYILKEARVGLEFRGAYIHFVLSDTNDEIWELIIKGIKNFEYEKFEGANGTIFKYAVSYSDEPLFVPDEDATSIPVQTGRQWHRFFLHRSE